MSPLPVIPRPSLRQIWGTHTFTRPPNHPRHPQPVIRLIPWQRLVCNFTTYRKIRSRRRKFPYDLWKDVPAFQPTTPRNLVKEDKNIRMKAHLLRWSGRRSLYLGNYKLRRDAGFSRADVENLLDDLSFHPVTEKLFQNREAKGLDYPCAPTSRHIRRQFGVGEKFGIDFDSSEFNAFYHAARKKWTNKSTSLTEPFSVDYPPSQPTKWPGPKDTKMLVKRFYERFQTKILLEENVLYIQLAYDFLIRRFINRPYMRGLLRLMVSALASRNEWRLLFQLCKIAIGNKRPFMSSQNVASLINYVAAESLRKGTGQDYVEQLYSYARRERSGSRQRALRQYKIDFNAAAYDKVPAAMKLGRPLQLKTSSKDEARSTSGGSLERYIADAITCFRVANHKLSDVVQTLELFAQAYIVPHRKTMNSILLKIIREENIQPAEPIDNKALLRADLQTGKLPVVSPSITTPSTSARPTSTSPPSGPSSPSVSPSLSGVRSLTDVNAPWLARMHTWQYIPKTPTKRTTLLRPLLPYFNQHNIHHTTIRLLAAIANKPSDLEIPWMIAQRAKHPMTVIQKSQEALVEAGCRAVPFIYAERHIRLSRGFLLIMKLEAMGIVPSRESIMTALRASVRDSNIIGARALVDYLKRYDYSTLRSHEVADLVKLVPSRGLGILSSATGEVVSQMWVRSEQLAFISDLRSHITDISYFGPYVLAVGRCGSSAEIWSVWKSLRERKLKDGLVTAFVEAFVAARDLTSAIEFVKDAYSVGYALNHLRATVIAKAIEPGQRKVGVYLVSEMAIQKSTLTNNEMRDILATILMVRRGSPEEWSAKQEQFLTDLSTELAEIREVSTHERDIEHALEEIDRILGA